MSLQYLFRVKNLNYNDVECIIMGELCVTRLYWVSIEFKKKKKMI